MSELIYNSTETKYKTASVAVYFSTLNPTDSSPTPHEFNVRRSVNYREVSKYYLNDKEIKFVYPELKNDILAIIDQQGGNFLTPSNLNVTQKVQTKFNNYHGAKQSEMENKTRADKKKYGNVDCMTFPSISFFDKKPNNI